MVERHTEKTESNWREKVSSVRARLRAEPSGTPFPPPEEMLQKARAERDDQLAGRKRVGSG